MRIRTMVVAGLVPVLFVACDRAAELSEAEPADLDARLELALPGEPATAPGIASAIELPPPPPPERAEPRVERAPPRQPVPAPVAVATDEGAPQPAVPAVAATPEEPGESAVPAHDHAAAPATGRTPLEAKGGVQQRVEDGGHGDHVSGGIVIIRGGAGSGIDPCAVHGTQPGVVMTPVIPDVAAMTPPPLINDRVPRVGGNGIPLGGAGDPEQRPNAGATVGRGGVGTTATGMTGGRNSGTVTRGGIGSRGGVPARGGMRGGIR